MSVLTLDLLLEMKRNDDLLALQEQLEKIEQEAVVATGQGHLSSITQVMSALEILLGRVGDTETANPKKPHLDFNQMLNQIVDEDQQPITSQLFKKLTLEVKDLQQGISGSTSDFTKMDAVMADVLKYLEKKSLDVSRLLPLLKTGKINPFQFDKLLLLDKAIRRPWDESNKPPAETAEPLKLPHEKALKEALEKLLKDQVPIGIPKGTSPFGIIKNCRHCLQKLAGLIKARSGINPAQ